MSLKETSAFPTASSLPFTNHYFFCPNYLFSFCSPHQRLSSCRLLPPPSALPPTLKVSHRRIGGGRMVRMVQHRAPGEGPPPPFAWPQGEGRRRRGVRRDATTQGEVHTTTAISHTNIAFSCGIFDQLLFLIRQSATQKKPNCLEPADCMFLSLLCSRQCLVTHPTVVLCPVSGAYYHSLPLELAANATPPDPPSRGFLWGWGGGSPSRRSIKQQAYTPPPPLPERVQAGDSKRLLGRLELKLP